MNSLKKILRKNKPQPTIKDLTLGEKDSKGFCDLYVDGQETDIKLLIFTQKQGEMLQKIVDKL